MSELGQVLQKAREEKGITLDDIQRVTKIQRRYLEAIERGHFNMLPGHFYARAFIKSYAEAVGLDPQQILEHYQADLPSQPPTEQVERLRRRRAASANNPLQASRWIAKALLVLFVALIIGVTYLAIVNNDGDITTQPIPSENVSPGAGVVSPGEGQGVPPVSRQPEPSDNTAAPAPSPAPEAPKVSVTLASQNGSLFQYDLQGGEKIAVTLKATHDRSWFGVGEAKGKYVMQGELKSGEEKSVELGKTAFIRLGKPMNVQLTVNGVVVDTSKVVAMPSDIQISVKESAAQ